MDRLAAIVVGAGRGERFGKSSKVLALLDGVPLLEFSIELINNIPDLEQVVFVLGSHTLDDGRQVVIDHCQVAFDCVIGGPSRSESVVAGLEAIGRVEGLVLVHDAARPLATGAMIGRLIAAARETGAAAPVMPVTDSLLEVDGVEAVPVERERYRAVQTPQVARYDWLRDALGAVSTPTDESSALLAQGYPVELVDGEPENIKITHPEDLVIAEALLRARKGGA